MSLTQSWKSYIAGFEVAKPTLKACVKSGQLAYVYTNGFVLPNKPFNGSLMNNDSAMMYDIWLRENLGKQAI